MRLSQQAAYDWIAAHPHGVTCAEFSAWAGSTLTCGRIRLGRLKAIGVIGTTHRGGPRARWTVVDLVDALRAEINAKAKAVDISRRKERQRLRRSGHRDIPEEPIGDPILDEHDDWPVIHMLVDARDAKRPAVAAPMSVFNLHRKST